MQIAAGLTFPGELKDESVICHLCKKFQIELIIIEASFSVARGWAILEFKGEEEEIKKVFEYLKQKRINIQKIKKEDQSNREGAR